MKSDWNSQLGVWSSMKATSDTDELPCPLFVFGYGSLIWRPGDLLEDLQSFRCTALGWKRVFAMRSCDHRGTVEFPGLVLNMVNEDLLKEYGYIENMNVDCEGMIWLIPPEKSKEVIAELDYRERGGYHRHTIKVRLQSATPYHSVGDVIDVLVYTGQPSNPQFYFKPNPFELSEKPDEDIFHLYRRNVITDIISASHGPSGANVDYLFNLEYYLGQCDMVDSYLVDLAESVRHRLGTWRSRAYIKNIATGSDLAEPKSNVIVGCGSNEFHQLNLRDTPVYLSSIHDHHYYVSTLDSGSSSSSSMRCHTDVRSFVAAGGGTSAVVDHGLLQVRGKLAAVLWKSVSDQSLLCSSNTSSHYIEVEGVDNIALGHDHLLILLSTGQVAAFGSDSHSQCSGGSEAFETAFPGQGNVLFISPSDVVLEKCSSDEQSLRFKFGGGTNLHQKEEETVAPAPSSVSVLKLAVGLHHSAAITEEGVLITWGDRSFGQALSLPAVWRPTEATIRLIDVSCGTKHTVVVDSTGVVYSTGCNKHHALGRTLIEEDKVNQWKKNCDGELRKVDLPQGVRWQKVSCGWTHAVARGILPNGELVFYGWGRRDMGQYLTVDDSGEGGSEAVLTDDSMPVELRPLPGRRVMVEVWAGSEFTLAADIEGHLWGCGWNEHGNLGAGDKSCSNVKEEWLPVLQYQPGCNGSSSRVGAVTGIPIVLSRVWEGAVACGGGHIICRI